MSTIRNYMDDCISTHQSVWIAPWNAVARQQKNITTKKIYDEWVFLELFKAPCEWPWGRAQGRPILCQLFMAYGNAQYKRIKGMLSAQFLTKWMKWSIMKLQSLLHTKSKWCLIHMQQAEVLTHSFRMWASGCTHTKTLSKCHSKMKKMKKVETIFVRHPYPHDHSRHAILVILAASAFFISTDNLDSLLYKLDTNIKWWSIYGCLFMFFYFFSSPFVGKTIEPNYSNFSRWWVYIVFNP